MSKSKKAKPAKKAAPKSGLVAKPASFGNSTAKQGGMIPTSGGNISSSKKGSAQNNAPRKAQ